MELPCALKFCNHAELGTNRLIELVNASRRSNVVEVEFALTNKLEDTKDSC